MLSSFEAPSHLSGQDKDEDVEADQAVTFLQLTFQQSRGIAHNHIFLASDFLRGFRAVPLPKQLVKMTAFRRKKKSPCYQRLS